MNPLVSIITTCYNGESYLARYLNSVLIQTYDNIELVLVNDGSTDRTDLIANEYISQFNNKGYKYNYIVQENGGLANAVNTGLKVFHGKYFMLADSDDILEPDCVLKKVEYLEAHPDLALVAARAKIVDENNIEKTIGYLYNKSQNWCEDIVFKDGVVCNGGIYMLRTENFLKIYPQRHIFESRAGQNYQILIPMAYYFKYGTIDDIVYTYVVRRDSLSHKKTNIEGLYNRFDEFIKILENTTKCLPDKYRENYIDRVYKHFAMQKFYCSLKQDNLSIAKKTLDDLGQYNINSFKKLTCLFKYWQYRIKLLFKSE